MAYIANPVAGSDLVRLVLVLLLLALVVALLLLGRSGAGVLGDVIRIVVVGEQVKVQLL